jgi:hypothetical protein
MIDVMLKTAYLDVLDRAQAYSICAGLAKSGNIVELQKELIDLYRDYSISDVIGLTDSINKVNEMMDELIAQCNTSIQKDIAKFINDKRKPVDADTIMIEMNSSIRQILEDNREILNKLSRSEPNIIKMKHKIDGISTQIEGTLSKPNESNYKIIVPQTLKNGIMDYQSKEYTLISRVNYYFNTLPLDTYLYASDINSAVNGKEPVSDSSLRAVLSKLKYQAKIETIKDDVSYLYYINKYTEPKLIRSNKYDKSEKYILEMLEPGKRYTAREIGLMHGVTEDNQDQRRIRKHLLKLYESGKLKRDKDKTNKYRMIYWLSEEQND